MTKHHIQATCFDRKGKVISHAVNDYNKSHPMQAKFARVIGQPERIYLHAELLALLRIPRGTIAHSMKIVRTRKDGSTALAKPCPICEAALAFYQIKEITYSL